MFSCCILQTIAIPVHHFGYYIKVSVINLMLTYWCDKIWNFLFLDLLPSSFIHQLFLLLTSPRNCNPGDIFHSSILYSLVIQLK